MTQDEHAELMCPIISGTPRCATDKCALWRWTAEKTEITGWINLHEGKVLETQGWKHRCNNGGNSHQYERSYPPGQRPGACSLAMRG